MNDERVFRGTAPDYTRFRLPYPQPMFEALIAEAREGSGTGRLLDLGCGPGRVVLPLAPAFAQAVAVDPEPEMISEGKRVAAQLGVSNIEWVVARAEDVEYPDRSIDLVTVGQAFHWFDQRLVADRIRGWLRDDGAVALIWQMCPWCGDSAWHHAVADVLGRWTGRGTATKPTARTRTSLPFEDVLHDAEFRDIETRLFHVPHVWSLDSLAGFFRSTSAVSLHSLGEHAEEFDRDLRESLLVCDPRGEFAENVEFGFMIGRR